MDTGSKNSQSSNSNIPAYLSYDLKPSKVQIIRRLSMETYMVRVYAGPLSQDTDYVSVEAEKTTSAAEIVQVAARKLRLAGGAANFELAEVFSSGGQLCKERRLEDMDNPVGIQLLWPKVINADVDSGLGLFTGYRFYIRRKDPEISRTGWIECKDQSVVDTFLMSFLQQPVGSKEYQDLCNLPDLNEQTLLQNLKARFNSSNIYTYVGSILIALNPFKFFPIYNPKYVKMYQNKRLGELPPHIFAIADAAYHTMLQTRQNQCIVISGESGSGKTESTNLLLHHLTALSHKGLHGSGVEQTILGAGPVLEAFGNAKTVHNNNSSRFGKFIQVNYKENGMVHGAIVEKYLLEKSRIVSQARNERNYHVFYYLLAGADQKERETLFLSRPEDYKYLSQSTGWQTSGLDGVDEEHEFARLKQSMEMVGFSAETQRKIFCVLSAVLHLGNVEFRKKGDQHHDESVVVKNEPTVKVISQLLKVKEKTVMEALTQKRSTAGDETFIINYKMEDALATRDAMAKCIYGSLFDWIVLKVNQALLAKKHNSEHEGNSIGVLDIFGFEDFGKNSFEQLCINYANEHLQYYFNQHIFKFEQEEYQREGIQWKNIEFIDNTGCLELFSKRPGGLFCLLDEECNFPGATNETLLIKFAHNNRSNSYYQVPQITEGAFNIVHYAGKVKYYVKDFREKNSDLVRPEIVGTLKKSSMAFVRELMGVDPVAVLRWSVVRAFFHCFFAFIRAGEKFRKNGGAEKKVKKRLSDSQIQDSTFSESVLKRHVLHEELLLYSSIESNLPPNDAQVIRKARKLIMKNKSFRPKPRPSLSFRDIKTLKAIASRTMFAGGVRFSSKKQPPSVGAQFQWSLSRLMTTLNQANPFFIRCIKSNTEKAPCKFDDEIVLRQLRYTGMLATVKIRQSGYNYRLLFEEFIQLYQILLPKGLLSSKENVIAFLNSMHLNPDNFQIGKTKVFLRESEKLMLDEALHTAIMQRVVYIQACVKARLERQHFLQAKQATIVLQKHFRRCLAQKLLHRLQLEHYAALTIQRYYRGWRFRRMYLAYRALTVILQGHIRAFLTRRRFLAILAEKERKHMEEEKEKARLRHQEELQSFASDEGVMLKGSSAEELEEKEFPKIQRRDSEESSGILEDSEMELVEPRSPKDFLVTLPPIPTITAEAEQPERKGDVLEESQDSTGRVRELAQAFLQTPQASDIDNRTYFVRRGSQRRRHRLSSAPLAKQESFSDLELSPTGKDAGAAAEIALSGTLSPDCLQMIEEAVAKGRTRQEHHDGPDMRPLPDNALHLSPFHKARKHIKNIVGGARRKKDVTDSDEESEDFVIIPSASSPAKRMAEIGVSVLPPVSTPSLTVTSNKENTSVMKVEEGSKQVSQEQPERTKRKNKKQRPNRTQGSNQIQAVQSRSNVKFSGTSEWQYPDDMKINDVQDLHALDAFISQKCRELFKNNNDGKKQDKVFDRIFKGALDEFGKELKTVVAVEMQHDEVEVKCRDLFEKFKNVLKAEMCKEQNEAPYVMALNAFRGFLDEFMKQLPVRRKERKDDIRKPDKVVKRDKQKKDVVEHLGHKFLQIQFSIPTFCEYCSSFIWILDKGQVCQMCKYTCHKKCSVKSSSACKGYSSCQNPSNAKVFGAPLESLLKEGMKIPIVVENLIKVIEMQGLFTEGLYRKSGAAPKARELKMLLETNPEAVDLSSYPVHVLTTVLKSFFRELPEPLLTYELYDDFLRGSEIKDRKEQVQCMFAVIDKLPKPNHDLFERLIFHLVKVAMHEESTKMTANGIAIVFAPCLLRSNKKIQAQETLNQVPKQTSCIDIILSEELATVRSKLDDISTLETAEKTTEERLTVLRASMRSSQLKPYAPKPPLARQESVQEEEEGTEMGTNSALVAEERALSAQLATINKEKKNLTSKLPMLETRQASSDEDMLTGDETDSYFDPADVHDEGSEESGVAFDVPAVRHSFSKPPISTSRHERASAHSH